MICEYIKLKSESRNHFSISSNHTELRTSSSLFPYRGVMIARNQEVCTVDGKLQSNCFHLSVQFAQLGYQIQFFDSSSNPWMHSMKLLNLKFTIYLASK